MNESPRTAHVLVNPAARKVRRFDPEAALRRLDAHGIDAILEAPRSPEAFARAARRAVDRAVDLLFVAGGDGTMRLAGGELVGAATALAPLPLGTANILTTESGLPGRWERAIDAHAGGQRVRMDVGLANGEIFLLMAGIGWDAAIASRVRRDLKHGLGALAYILEAAKAIPGLRPRPLQMDIDGRDFGGDWGLIVLSNTRLYGGLVHFAPEASAVDGLLDVCAAGPRRPGQGTALATRLATNRLREQPGLHLDRAAEVNIPTPGAPVQLDGDVVGETPMRFTVMPQALLLSVPSGPLPALFRAGGGDTRWG